MISLSGARNVDGGTLVNASAEKRRTYGRVRASIEAHKPYWYVPLTMMLDNYHVELSSPDAYISVSGTHGPVTLIPFCLDLSMAGPIFSASLGPERPFSLA